MICCQSVDCSRLCKPDEHWQHHLAIVAQSSWVQLILITMSWLSSDRLLSRPGLPTSSFTRRVWGRPREPAEQAGAPAEARREAATSQGPPPRTAPRGVQAPVQPLAPPPPPRRRRSEAAPQPRPAQTEVDEQDAEAQDAVSEAALEPHKQPVAAAPPRGPPKRREAPAAPGLPGSRAPEPPGRRPSAAADRYAWWSVCGAGCRCLGLARCIAPSPLSRGKAWIPFEMRLLVVASSNSGQAMVAGLRVPAGHAVALIDRQVLHAACVCAAASGWPPRSWTSAAVACVHVYAGCCSTPLS